MEFFIILAVMFGFFWLILIRPQKQQQRRHQDLLANLKPGDEVITTGGIYGDIAEVHDDRVSLEIAEDVWIEVAKPAIASVVPPETFDEPEAVEEPAPEAEAPEEQEPVEEPAGR